MGDNERAHGVSDEQLLYARILAAGMYSGLVILLVTFTLYLSGAAEPVVPIHELPGYWTMSVDDYLETVNTQHLHGEHALTGWWWLTAVSKGDFMNFLGIAVLSMVTLVCFVGILPTLIRKRDWVYAAIATAEVVILALAASGILTGGH
ncbi:MAG: hypothetical protein PVJ02_19770 [Gemmatimonadota bacterium]|jgi:hypothetical protein